MGCATNNMVSTSDNFKGDYFTPAYYECFRERQNYSKLFKKEEEYKEERKKALEDSKLFIFLCFREISKRINKNGKQTIRRFLSESK